MKKKIIFLLVLILLIVIGVISFFGYNYYLDNKEKVLLQNEVKEVLKCISEKEVNLKKIEEITSPKITSGNRLAVEEALEEYILVSANTINTTITLLNDERITNLLSDTNFQNDGPAFLTSKTYINETKQKLLQNKKDILSLTDTSKIMSYFKNSTNDIYYEEMYRNLAIGNGLKETDIKTFSDSIDKIINLLDVSSKALNLLSENSNAWHLQNNQIYFNNQELLNTYNNLIAQIK